MKDNNIQKSIYDSEKLIEWGGFLNEFLWICAGADRKVLRQCPTDYAKYAGIGGTILFTALMAMLSGGYALFTVFNNVEAAIGFGIFWGMLIFNLDRFIVNTMYSDGKVTISWNEFVCGLPRIIMAIFLGVVISTPLELKIYEQEINVRIGEDAKKKIDAYRAADQNRIDSLTAVIAEIRERPDKMPEDLMLKGEAANIQNDLNKKHAALQNVVNDIRILTGKRSALNPNTQSKAYNSLSAQINQKSSQRNKLNLEIRNLQGQLGVVSQDYRDAIKKSGEQKAELIKTLMAQIKEAQDNLKNSAIYEELIKNEYGGFEARMAAFHGMRADNPSTDISAWFIMMLFIIIETAPTFFKMMIASGPYDDLLRAEMHKVKVLSEKRISDINDNINTEVQITVDKNKARLDAELAANKLVMEKLAAAQAELLERAIEDWRKEELEKVIANPSAYVQSASTKS